MSKRKPRSTQRPVARPAAAELPAVEFLTVAWMLSVMTTLVCELGLAAVRGYLLMVKAESPRIEVLADMLLFAAFVIGLLSLFLAIAVYRTRRTPPPLGILVFSLVVAVVPALTLLLGGLRQFAIN